MRKRKLGTLFTAVQIVAVIACLSLPALAQQSAASPPPAPAGSSLPGLFENLAIRAANLIPLLQNEIEKPMLVWFERLSYGLAGVIFTFAFARMWRENAGAGVDLFWWFGRAVVCLALMGNGPTLINKLGTIGQEIASGSDSVLARFYGQQRISFETSYRKFAEGHFTVKPTGEEIKPPPGGEEALLGVLYDVTSSPKDVNRKLETLSRDMPTLFTLLSAARGIIDFGDLYLLLLGGFLLLVVRLAAPVMIALAIDRELARKISYPYLWGTIVLTLVWPAVSQLIRAFAYLGGNLAMALDAGAPLYQWNPVTMQEITNNLEHPFYTVMLAAAIMTVAGLSLWISPYIAYKVSAGQVYESVSSTVSGWTGAIVGAGIEMYSSSLGSSITRQAEQQQVQGQYQGEVTRAEAGREAGNLGIRARQSEKLAQLFAQQGQQISLANAWRDFQNAATYGQSMHNYRTMMAARTKENNDNKVAGKQQLEALKGGAIGDALGIGGGTLSRRGIDGFIIGAPLQQGGNVLKWWMQGKSVVNGAGGRTKNIQEYYDAVAKSLDTYNKDMYGAHGNYAGAQVAAAKAYANQTAGGINQAAALERQANMVNYDGAVKAAGQVRDAAIEAARLRAVAAVVSSVGHNIARDMEQGLTLRY